MLSSFRASRCHRSENKRRRKTSGKSPARREVFRALGWEPLEHRVLLTATTPATITWTGGSATSANWSDPGNWDLGRAPVNGDSLVFPGSAQQLDNNDDIPGLSVNSVTFDGDFGTGRYTISGDDLTLGAGGITDDGVPDNIILGVVNQINLNLNLSAAQTWSMSDTGSNHDHELIVNGNVNNAGFALTMTGQDLIDMAGQISGSGGVTVSGATLDLQNANSYTGMTYVYSGTLLVDGSTSAGSGVYVGAASALGGAGTVGGTITVTGGDLSPGAGPDPSVDTGTLTGSGDMTLSGFYPPVGQGAARQAEFDVQLGGTAAAPTNDQLNAAGSVALSGARLALSTLGGAGPFNAGQQFVIVQAGAPISGAFVGLPEGSTVSDGAQNFTISYANDRVTLTAQSVSPSAVYLNGQAGDGTPATFIHNLYRELLGREPDAAEQSYWVTLYGQLQATGSRVPGAPSAQQIIVADFLGSSEYRAHLVEGIYTTFLHRAADAGGLAFWTNAMANGLDEKNVLADILGSEEYEIDALGPGVHPDNDIADAAAWVTAMYRDVLGRTADPAGAAFWTQQAINVGRTTAALEFLSSPEVEQKLLNGNYPGAPGSVGAPGSPALGAYALADTTGNGWDNLYFQGNLSANEVDAVFAQLQAGEGYGAAISGMLDMQQYFG